MTVIQKLTSLFGRSLSCEQVNQFLVDYLEGDLPYGLRTRFEVHVAHCPACGSFLDQYRHTLELVREAGEALPQPPDELVEATMAFLRDHLDESMNLDPSA